VPRPRQDTRRGPGRGDRDRIPSGPPPGPGGGRIQRAPGAAHRPRDGRPQRDGGQRDRGGRDGQRDRGPRRDSPARVFEPPVPQDERSVELGARFREAQVAMREAKKALAKRNAEFSDEPAWMLEQIAAAEQAFEAIATEWADHLGTTGRKVIRR
jgi:hypothetical protein